MSASTRWETSSSRIMWRSNFRSCWMQTACGAFASMISDIVVPHACWQTVFRWSRFRIGWDTVIFHDGKHLCPSRLQHKAVLGRCHAFRTWISDGKGVAFSLLFSLQKPGKPCCTRRFQHWNLQEIRICPTYSGRKKLEKVVKYSESVQSERFWLNTFNKKLAEWVGFEPTVPLPVHLISSQNSLFRNKRN